MSHDLLENASQPVLAEREPSVGQSVYIWLDDPGLLPEVGRRCLHLDCDRVEVAGITRDGEDALLVRIDAPPFYVVEWCRSQSPERVQVFTAMSGADGLFIEWGFEHPMASLWRRRWDVESDGWLFFTPGHPAQAQRRLAAPERWRSIYEALDLSIDVATEETWQLEDKTLEPFPVPIRLVPRLRPGEPELVLAGPEDEAGLEAQLADADPDTLEQVEVSVQRDGAGREYYLLRNRQARDQLTLERFPGRRFDRFRGMERLLLPVDCTLRPSLRRDRYREIFELDRGEMTLVVPTAQQGEARLFRVPEASFVPFERLVEHFVGFDKEQLATIVGESVFDLGPYRVSPSRPDLLGQRQGGQVESRPRADIDEPEEPSLEEDSDEDFEPLELEVPEPIEEEEVEPEAPVAGDLEKEARRLERQLIVEGPSTRRWDELCEIQTRRGAYEDAAQCALEALWHEQVGQGGELAGVSDAQQDDVQQDDARRMARRLVELVESAPETYRLDGWTDALFALEKVLADADPAGWLIAADRELRRSAQHLPVKLRWLAWREVLRRNRDVRTYQEQRDALLDELNERGLSPQDTPRCIRDRIIHGPPIGTEHETEDETEQATGERDISEYEANERVPGGQHNLGVVAGFFLDGPDDRLRTAACASAARVAARHGWESASDRYLGATRHIYADGPPSEPFWRRLARVFNSARPEGVHQQRFEVVTTAWVQLMSAYALAPYEPIESNAIIQAFFETLEDMPESNQTEFERVQQRIRDQRGSDDTYLVESTRMLFASHSLDDSLRELIAEMESADQEGDISLIFEFARQAIEQARSGLIGEGQADESADFRQAAGVMRRTVSVLRRHQWSGEHSPMGVFEPFVDALVQAPPTRATAPLYYAVARFAASRALLELGRDERALKLANRTLDWLAESPIPCLDFIDVIRSEALMIVELAPPERRNLTLRHLMRTIEAQHEAQSDYLETPAFAFAWLEMLDQVAESAVSKARYAHRRLREWEERDEFMIRQVLHIDRPHEESP